LRQIKEHKKQIIRFPIAHNYLKTQEQLKHTYLSQLCLDLKQISNVFILRQREGILRQRLAAIKFSETAY
jgi:hypothetical protein